jgi:hypothetical protein
VWADSGSDVRFSNRPGGVKRFQTVRGGVNVTRGLVLLSGNRRRARACGCGPSARLGVNCHTRLPPADSDATFDETWVKAAWSNAGVSYARSDLPKSQLYLECVPLFTRGLVKLPDHAKLLRELRLLERHTHRSGRDTVGGPSAQWSRRSRDFCVRGSQLAVQLSQHLCLNGLGRRPQPRRRRQRRRPAAAAVAGRRLEPDDNVMPDCAVRVLAAVARYAHINQRPHSRWGSRSIRL